MAINLADISYRFVSPQEWPQIKDRAMGIDFPFWQGTPLAGNEDDYAEMFTHPQSMTYVAEHNGRLIGFVNCVPAEAVAEWYLEDDGTTPSDYFEEIGGNSSYVHGVTVDAPYHRHGIGSELLALAMKDSKLRGYDTLSGYYNHDTSKKLLDRTRPRISKPIPNFGDSGHTYEFGVTDLGKFQPKDVEPSKALVPYKR